MPAKKVVLSEKKYKSVLNCIEHIEENAIVSADGNVSINIDIPLYFTEEILLEFFPAGWDFPERTKRRILSQARMRWLKYKKTNNPQHKINLFIRALKTEIGIVQKEQSVYKVLMFLNVAPSTMADFSQVRILGEELNLISWEDVSKFDIKDLWQEVNFHDRHNPILWDIPDLERPAPDAVKFSPVMIEINTYGPEAAIEIATNQIDLLRVIMNIPAALGGFTIYRSKPKALSEILPSPIYVIFDRDGKRNSVYYTIEKFDYQQKKIPNDRKSSVQFLLSKVNVSPKSSSTWAYLLNVLRLYQKALDTTTTEAAFLTMWQVLENCIGLGEEIPRNRDIHSRIFVFVPDEPLLIEMVEIITDKRNKLVHAGKFLEDGDHLFFTLKLITDSILRRLFYLADRYPTLSELRDYVAFSSLGDSDLQRKQSVIEKIIDQRRSG